MGSAAPIQGMAAIVRAALVVGSVEEGDKVSRPLGCNIYSETVLWQRIVRPLVESMCVGRGLPYHTQRIENMAGVGNPDVDYCIAGNTGHIELKQSRKNPKRGAVLGKGKGLRRSQIVWATRRTRAQGRVFVCIGVPSGAVWFVDLRSMKPETLAGIEMLTSFGLDEISSWRSGQDPLHLLELLRS